MKYLVFFYVFFTLASCSSSPEYTLIEPTSLKDLTIRGDGDYILTSNSNTGIDTITIEAGTLTAGQWNDLEDWDFWNHLMKESSYQDYQDYWEMYPRQRYEVRVVDALGQPARDIKVQLKDPKIGVLWESRTNHKGIATLWTHPFVVSAPPLSKDLKLVLKYQGKTKKIGDAIPFEEGIAEWQLSPKINTEIDKLEVLFVVDATGSMEDEINYLKTELQDVVKKYELLQPNIKLRLGSVFYRDYPPKADYLTRQVDLSSDLQATFDFINQQDASGGGDFEEAVAEALSVAIEEQKWSDSKATRLVFLLLDAPAHHNLKSLEQLQGTLKKAAAQGVRIIPIASSGIDKETEFLMRFFSILTGGTYVFITDHSGVGKGHIEPTVGDYEVEYLNDLLLNLLQQYTNPSINTTQKNS